MEILLFGKLGDIVGKEKLETDHFDNTYALQQSLEKQFPALGGIKYMVAVNKQVVQQPTPLKGDETIALMPPFSGG